MNYHPEFPGKYDRRINPRTLTEIFMSVESKLNALLSAQSAQNTAIAAIATAVTNIPGANNGGLSDQITKLQSGVDSITKELGTDADGTSSTSGASAPVATPQPTQAPTA